jgi:hypothetical protein
MLVNGRRLRRRIKSQQCRTQAVPKWPPGDAWCSQASAYGEFRAVSTSPAETSEIAGFAPYTWHRVRGNEKDAQGRLPVRWRMPLLWAQEITATCDHDLRVRHGGNGHRRDGDRHGSGDPRRRRSQSSARIRSSRDKAHSNLGPRSSRTGEMPDGSASDRDVASNAGRDDSVQTRRWKYAALPTPSDYQPAPLKPDREAVQRQAEARPKTAT